MLRASILGASVWGPGLPGWAASRPVLAGAAPYVPTLTPAPSPSVLPAAERRRSGPVVRLALAVATEAAAAARLPPASLRSVFASSNGDGPVTGGILEALAAADEERAVSPTQFHNSVHNAAAGYWSIAIASHQPATCIGCHDDSVAAGLLTALAELHASGAPVLLCCYDHPLPPPLDAARPTGPPFAAAFVLAHSGGPTLQVTYMPDVPATRVVLADPALAALAAQNPAARALPLLASLARGDATRLELPYLDGRLLLELSP